MRNIRNKRYKRHIRSRKQKRLRLIIQKEYNLKIRQRAPGCSCGLFSMEQWLVLLLLLPSCSLCCCCCCCCFVQMEAFLEPPSKRLCCCCRPLHPSSKRSCGICLGLGLCPGLWWACPGPLALKAFWPLAWPWPWAQENLVLYGGLAHTWPLLLETHTWPLFFLRCWWDEGLGLEVLFLPSPYRQRTSSCPSGVFFFCIAHRIHKTHKTHEIEKT